MATSLTFDEHGAGIGSAWTALRDYATRAGHDTAVPTCPGWTVRDLVAHQGTVHRWATGIVLGEERRDPGHDEQEGRSSGDLLGWLDEGVKALLAALARGPQLGSGLPRLLAPGHDGLVGLTPRHTGHLGSGRSVVGTTTVPDAAGRRWFPSTR